MKNTYIQIRLSGKEKEKLKKLAEEKGYSTVSEYIRRELINK